jgi:hypothetical protein
MRVGLEDLGQLVLMSRSRFGLALGNTASQCWVAQN